jgi:hypothetical protein
MYYNFVRIHQTLKVSPAMAAGVTIKLWEVSDIVEMLEKWELANFKPEYQFVVRQYAIGKGHSVSVLWRGGEVDTIFGFEKEADALAWIKEKSQTCWWKTSKLSRSPVSSIKLLPRVLGGQPLKMGERKRLAANRIVFVPRA